MRTFCAFFLLPPLPERGDPRIPQLLSSLLHFKFVWNPHWWFRSFRRQKPESCTLSCAGPKGCFALSQSQGHNNYKLVSVNWRFPSLGWKGLSVIKLFLFLVMNKELDKKKWWDGKAGPIQKVGGRCCWVTAVDKIWKREKEKQWVCTILKQGWMQL